MEVIRQGVFETNSSSTHTICIMNESQYNDWQNNKIFRPRYKNEFFTQEEKVNLMENLMEEYAKENNIDKNALKEDEDLFEGFLDYYYEDIPLSFEEFDDWQDLERDYTEYTTPNGEKIIILCWYGNEH